MTYTVSSGTLNLTQSQSQNEFRIIVFIYVHIALYLKNHALLSHYHAVQFAIFLFTWLRDLTMRFTKIFSFWGTVPQVYRVFTPGPYWASHELAPLF